MRRLRTLVAGFALCALSLWTPLLAAGSAEPKAQRTQGKLEPWPEAEEQKVEDALNRFFAAKDPSARKAIHKELESTRLDRRLDELERMAEAAAAKGLQRHLPVPWRKGAPRGWFNLALPNGYTPAKAWPLVLALHGMPSDGDNLVPWYSGYFPQRGYMVLFPTTIDRSSFWPAPHERRELFRLIRHVADLYRVDCRRIYCSGASGGGIGTWHWLTTMPELFAAGISFSAMGTIYDERLKKLKDVPFYVHHGTADPIPIGTVERSIAMAAKYGAKIEFYASKGTGHTPPAQDWTRAFDWLVKQPPKKVSPRYLLECPEGALPTGYPRYLPFAASPDAAEVQAIVAANKAKVAKWQVPGEIGDYGLVEGMVRISKIVDPACDLAAVQREVKRIADAVRAKGKDAAEPADTLYALNEVFFQTEGFSRDGSDPAGEKPEGLAANQVLKARVGHVLTLAALYVAVAQELSLPVFPVTSPYHAFARCDDGKKPVNVETTELGGHFDDSVYAEGYGLAKLPSAAELKAKGTARLLAGQLGALSAIARRGGDPEKSKALAKLALGLDPDGFGALLESALAAKDEKRADDALRLARRLTTLWPDYAAPRLLEGELLAQAGNRPRAVEAYQKGIAAKLKPYGAAAGFNAECYYRIAEIYAPFAQGALKAGNPSAVGYYNRFNAAILECLKLNPSHPKAVELLRKMGGRITTR